MNQLCVVEFRHEKRYEMLKWKFVEEPFILSLITNIFTINLDKDQNSLRWRHFSLLLISADASDAVYREHVNMAIHQIIQSEMRAEAIHVTQSNHWRHLHDSLSQRYFISPNGHIFIMHPGNILSDMYGRTFHWNSEYGWMPLGHFEAPQYVIWSLSPSGWVPVATDPIYMGLPGISISGTIDYHRSDCDPTRSEMPKLSFNDEIGK